MIMGKRILSFLPFFCLFALVSCLQDSGGQASADGRTVRPCGRVSIGFDIPGMRCGTRSSFLSDETGIRDVNVFLYRAGRLEWQEWRNSGDPLTLELLEGETYSLYALANVGERQAPAAERDMHQYVLDLDLAALGDRMPMASSPGLSFTVLPALSGGGIPAGNQVQVELVRLVAKYDFRVDRAALQYGSFTVESVRIRQASRILDVFGAGSAAQSTAQVADGDYASEADLARLNQSGTVSFYLLENCQGTLLPGNDDPWRKEYFDASVAGRAPLCTYLEVKGSYTDRSGGLHAIHTYRMFLGSDATTNFDILRNTEYTLTLSVTDLGVFHESWKVERGSVSDARSLRFEPSVVEIASPGSSQTALVCQPSGIDYSLEWDAAAFADAALSAPSQAGNLWTFTNTAGLDRDRTVTVRAVSFDGAVSAVCTLNVRSALPELEVSWDTVPPAYVAQAGFVRCLNVPDGADLSASSGDPSVARLVRQGSGFRVEALRAGSTTLTFQRTSGGRTSTRTLELSVLPVHLQVAGQRYRAFADGSANALRLDGGVHQTWALSYDQPRSSFDDALYAELLKPCHTAVKDGSSGYVEIFDIDEDGLYVSDWGADPASLAGTYTVSLTPRANIYAGAMEVLERTVVIDAPISFPSDCLFAGENRYYMPEPGDRMHIVSSGALALSLGDPSRLRFCIGYATGGYGEGSGYLPCPYALSDTDNSLILSPSYADLLAFFPAPYRLRGEGLYVFARLVHAISGRTAEWRLGHTEIWLDLAVTSKLERWSSGSDYDITDEDHYFLVPCLYSEKFGENLVTFSSAQAGGGGDLSLPPFYLPRAILTGIPDRIQLGGAWINLSEPYAVPGPSPAYRDWQLSDRSTGLRCPDITNWLWHEGDFGPDDYGRESYEALGMAVGSWFHRKLYWQLYDPNGRQTIADGGHFDIRSYGGFSGNYYLRVCDDARTLEVSDFDE